MKLGSESRSFVLDVLHALAFDLFHVSARILLNIIYAQLPPSTSNLNRTHLPIRRSHQAPAPILIAFGNPLVPQPSLHRYRGRIIRRVEKLEEEVRV